MEVKKMACFIVPVTEAVVTTIAKKVIEKKEMKAEAASSEINLENVKLEKFSTWRIMFDPIRARLASSCSRNGMSDAATDDIWFGATSMRSISPGVTIG